MKKLWNLKKYRFFLWSKRTQALISNFLLLINKGASMYFWITNRREKLFLTANLTRNFWIRFSRYFEIVKGRFFIEKYSIFLFFFLFKFRKTKKWKPFCWLDTSTFLFPMKMKKFIEFFKIVKNKNSLPAIFARRFYEPNVFPCKEWCPLFKIT